MTNLQILTKAIAKAVNNGFKNKYAHDPVKWIPFNRYYALLFKHDFAKAFWKQDNEAGGIVCDFIHPEGEKCSWDYTWEDHLQKMVLKDDPIRYLEQFLNEDQTKELNTS